VDSSPTKVNESRSPVVREAAERDERSEKRALYSVDGQSAKAYTTGALAEEGKAAKEEDAPKLTKHTISTRVNHQSGPHSVMLQVPVRVLPCHGDPIRVRDTSPVKATL